MQLHQGGFETESCAADKSLQVAEHAATCTFHGSFFVFTVVQWPDSKSFQTHRYHYLSYPYSMKMTTVTGPAGPLL